VSYYVRTILNTSLQVVDTIAQLFQLVRNLGFPMLIIVFNFGKAVMNGYKSVFEIPEAVINKVKPFAERIEAVFYLS
jgi:hypothetical protein